MLLKSMPGVENYSASVIFSMIGDVGRFNSSQNLISYTGLAPSVRSFADVARYGRITKRGDTLMRRILTVCPDSHSTRAKLVCHESTLQDWQKEGKRKAMVAAAAKLLHVAYLILKEGKKHHE